MAGVWKGQVQGAWGGGGVRSEGFWVQGFGCGFGACGIRELGFRVGVWFTHLKDSTVGFGGPSCKSSRGI